MVTVHRPKVYLLHIQIDVQPVFLDIFIVDGQVILDLVSPRVVGFYVRQSHEEAHHRRTEAPAPALNYGVTPPTVTVHTRGHATNSRGQQVGAP